MATVNDSPCPACAAPPGVLELAMKLVTKSLGTFSVAGVQMKTTGSVNRC